MPRDTIILSGADKGKLMVARSLIRFGISATIIFLLSGILTSFQVFQNFFRSYPTFLLLTSGLAGTVTLFGFLFLNLTGGMLFRYQPTLKGIKVVYWVVTASSAVLVSFLAALLKSNDLISSGSIFLSFALPSSFFIAAGLLARYTNIDFTKLDMPLLVLGLLLFFSSFLFFFITPSRGTSNLYLSLVILFYVGIILSDLSLIRKHREYIRLTESRDGIYGEEEERFSYIYSVRFLFSFVQLVRVLLILLSKR